jgi:hypothetical protein
MTLRNTNTIFATLVVAILGSGIVIYGITEYISSGQLEEAWKYFVVFLGNIFVIRDLLKNPLLLRLSTNRIDVRIGWRLFHFTQDELVNVYEDSEKHRYFGFVKFDHRFLNFKFISVNYGEMHFRMRLPKHGEWQPFFKDRISEKEVVDTTNP